MQLISRTKMLAGLGIAVASMAVALPAVASAAPAAAPAASPTKHTLGCIYAVDAQNISLFETPGGNRLFTLLDGQVVYSVPRTVVSGPDRTRYAFVMLQGDKDVGFINKTFLKDLACVDSKDS
jgi:hypothetical protein